MAQNLPKFEGDILDIGNNYYLVKKKVVYDWGKQIEKLKKDVEELKVKPVEKKSGTVAGKEGRNEVLNDEQKEQAKELRKRGYSLRQIAEVFDVSHETIRQVTLQETSQEKKQKEIGVSGLTIEQENLVKQQKKEGWTVKQCYESLIDMGEGVKMGDVEFAYLIAPEPAEQVPEKTSGISTDPLGDVPEGKSAADALQRIKLGKKTNVFGNK